MINQNISFKCITPCFCAGANQAKAELRPSAIRGALRWWFRCLGGTKEQEQTVFGGAESVRASSILIRISDAVESPFKVPHPAPKPLTPLAYILYFASIAGGQGANFGQGPRWNPQGAIAPGSSFNLQIRQLRRLDSAHENLLLKAIEAFKHYGSIGLRVTRGLGAVQWKDATVESFAQVNQMLEERHFVIKTANRSHNDWESLMREAGSWLKNDLRVEFGAGGNQKPAQATALGSIKPVRQTSAVYLRPIQMDGKLIFSAFEAPHSKVLGEVSKRPHAEPILKSRDFTKNPTAGN